MTGKEIRERFLEYFEQHGHARVASSPLLPANDPTLLFANAGMNQFKDVFTGAEQRDYTRAASSQKCIRAGGKHNDLDEVGKTARHHTFFEMLGNFSFGNYFKREAIEFAWDLLLNVYKLPVERLWFTVYKTDDEAARLWIDVGASPERILRFDEKDNFWQMGDTGPCGPCSEIHYYMGEDPHDPAKNRAEFVNGAGDTTMEIWNLVFMQYERDASGTLTPLPKPSVDTGMGLERLCAVLQKVPTNYDTDLIRPVIEFTAQLADINYTPESPEGFAMRVIADHARATAFAIADNILPGNEGRNYVLRKIMRRAIYQGRHTLHFEDAFFYKVTNFVVEQMRDVYPELEAAREFIERMVRLEEERFSSTLTAGSQKLHAYLSSLENPATDWKMEEIARIYDTYGLPSDLSRIIINEYRNTLEEHGAVTFGEDSFSNVFDMALRQIQGASQSVGTRLERVKAKPIYTSVIEGHKNTEFAGYEHMALNDAGVTALIKGDSAIAELREGEEGEVVLSRTPFYAESGGQVGDTGIIMKEHTLVTVNDTVSPVKGLTVHRVTVERGSLRVGDTVTAQVDVEKRDATRRNHTATHLLHAALRELLGTHVKQAGSLVAPNRLRFDFSHFQPLSRDEVAEIERLVNYQILRNEPVRTEIVPLEQAMQSGAMALFGEKYAEQVRVLTIEGFSKELCGGTHVRATGDIGLFKVVRDEAVASGTRRIEAVTGADAFMRFQETEALVDQVATELRTSRTEIPATIERLQEELKKARRESDELRLKLATGAGGSSASNSNEAREVAAGVRVLARHVEGLDAAGMRQLSDTLLARLNGSGVVVLGRCGEGKVSLIVRSSADLMKRVPAGQVIKEIAPIVGGRGGGKPDMAEGGGNQPEKLADALEASYAVVETMLN